MRRKLLSVLAGLAMAAGVVLTPTTASADVGVQGCQIADYALYYSYYKSDGTIGLWSKTCSGTYPLNSRGNWIDAGGWSGTVTFSGGDKLYFCDWESWSLNGQRVTQIFMSATKASWC